MAPRRQKSNNGFHVLKNFKIVFYKSELGELVKVKEFFRRAETLQELVADPPDEFFDMLGSFFPLHGWAEIGKENATVFVIFAPRADGGRLPDIEETEFQDWLGNVRPSDFKESGQ